MCQLDSGENEKPSALIRKGGGPAQTGAGRKVSSKVRTKGRPVTKDPSIAPAEQSTRDRQREAELRKKRDAEDEAERVKLAAENAALSGAGEACRG